MTDCPCQRPGVKPTSAYTLGCRHEASLTAVRNYRKRWRAGLNQRGWLNGTGTRRRLQALAATGWSANAIATRTGLSARWLLELRRGKNTRVERRTDQRIRAVYDQLWDQPGPCPIARRLAARAGWPPPMAWDDHSIDDPAAAPDLGRRPRSRVDDADVTHLASYGLTRDQIADRLGVTPDSLRDILARRRKAS